MKTALKMMFPVLALAVANLFPGCKKINAYPKAAVYLSSNPSVDQFLVDKDGNSLYTFANDANGISNCTGGCLNNWPVYYEDLSNSLLGEGLDPSDFGTITAAAGVKQTTYKGWPLYYHAPLAGTVNVREKPGELTGQGIGNIWFVAKPDYSVMISSFQLTGHNGKTYKSDLTEGTGRTTYFSDARGNTLYAFKFDSANINKYTKTDFSNNGIWPLYEQDKIVIPANLDKTLFNVITVFGHKQMTYKGWPLYYFGQDASVRGSNKGISFPAVGVWPVATQNAPLAPR
ncbi:MAG: hypothetical protein ABIX01_22165 [Chitinophagaceae bacterium]